MNRPFASFHQPRQPAFDASVYLNTKSRSPTKAAQKRSEQITHLHHEFESLKKKIKEVENKNEKIIQKIHKSFNFKKKATGTYTEQNLSMNEPSNEELVYFNQPYFQNSIIGSISQQNNQTHDSKSNASNQSQYQFNMRQKKKSPAHQIQKQHTTKSQDKNKFLSAFNKKEKMTEEYIFPDHKDIKVLPFRQQSDHHEKKFSVGEQFPVTATMPVSLMKSKISFTALEDKIQSLQNALNLEKQRSFCLSTQIQNLQSKVYQLQGTKQKFKGYAQSSKIIYETNFQNFVENIVRKWMLEVQRFLKKNQSKITNIFSLIYQIKDVKQERRRSLQLKKSISHQEYQKKLSRQIRIENNQEKSIDRDVSKGKRQQISKSRSKVNELVKKKQFQQIALKYQQIIKSNNLEIEKLDKKLKLKQEECVSLESKLEKLNRQVIQIEDSKFTFMPEYVRTLSRKKSKAGQNQSKDFQGLESQILLYTQNYEKEQTFLQNRNKNLEQQIKIKNDKIAELQKNIIELSEQKKFVLQKQQLRSAQNELKDKKYDELINKINILETEIAVKAQETIEHQQKIVKLEKINMEAQCQIYGYQSKIIKMEGELSLKCSKIEEIQKLLASNEQTDDHNRSINVLDQSERQNFEHLKAQIQKLEDQLITKNNEVFIANRNKQYAQKKIVELQTKCQTLQRQNESLYKELEQMKSISRSLIEQQQNKKFDSEQDEKQQKIHLEQLTQKYNALSRNFQQVKSEALEKDSKIIKLQSQLEYVSISDSQKKINLQKHKQEYSYLQTRNNELQKLINQKQMELEMEKKINSDKIKQMEKQWIEFQTQVKNNMGIQIDDNIHLSEKSSVVNFKNNFNRISTQNQYLIEKIKEVESELQMQKIMEAKIIDQYKNNVEKIKGQLKEKALHLQTALSQREKLIKQIGFFRQKEKAWQNRQLTTQNADVKDSYEKALRLERQRIQQLQAELAQTKEINEKLTNMSNQLFSEFNMKQAQNQEISKLLEQKNDRIRQLEESHGTSQDKCINLGSNTSHVSKEKQKDILKSQSSLRYSSFTQLRNEGRIDKTVDLDLSQAGSSFFDTSQMPINISQFFQREQLPYEKTKMKRKQQVKLFQKTAAYIKSLKDSINEKVKKIRVLQKKIVSMKSNQLVRKQLGPYELMEKDMKLDNSFELDDNFRDYQSVQLENKKGHHDRRYKILQHDTKLVIQQNNLLVQQVENLQQQLEKAQEQENSLVKIKDLYKEEIKKLMKKTQQLEEDAVKLRNKIAESQSIHHAETIKQLYGKIMILIKVVSFQSGRKKQEKKKQLGSLLQTMNKLLALDAATSTQILSLAKT